MNETLNELLSSSAANNKLLRELRSDMAFFSLGKEKILEIHEDGKRINFYIPFADRDLIQRKILSSFSFYEIGLLRKIKPIINGMNHVIDVGANIGNHSLFFSKICNINKINCFEPMPITFEILKKNIEINKCKGIELHSFGLGFEEGLCSISEFKPLNYGATSFVNDKNGLFNLKALDSLSYDSIDFVKIDVEGKHVEFLNGALETLSQHKPLIFIELRKSKNEFQSGYEILKKLGYVSFEILDDNNFVFKQKTL
jgi:FkbM family methyltransferase